MDNEAQTAQPAWHPRMIIIFIMGGLGVMGGGLLAPALPSLVEPFSVSEHLLGWCWSFTPSPQLQTFLSPASSLIP